MHAITFNGDPVADTSIVNLTPHPVVIATSRSRITIKPYPVPARLMSAKSSMRTIFVKGNPVEVFLDTPVEPVGLPAPVEGRILIVSRAVAERYPYRRDLVFPSELEKDSGTGAVVCCRSLSRLSDW